MSNTIGKDPEELTDDELLERIASWDVELAEYAQAALEDGQP